MSAIDNLQAQLLDDERLAKKKWREEILRHIDQCPVCFERAVEFRFSQEHPTLKQPAKLNGGFM